MEKQNLTRQEWKDSWTEWNIKRGAIKVDPVRLEKHGIVQFKTIEMAADDPFAAMKAEIDQYQDYVDVMLADAAKVSNACNELANEASEVGSEIFKKGMLVASGTMAVAGAAVWLGAKWYEGYKEQQINDEYNRKMKELLLEKKKVAEAKLKSVTERYNAFQANILSKVKALYEKEFDKLIPATDKQMAQKTDLFKRSFCMYIKSCYLSEILMFVINEMEAWKAGQHDAEYNPKPSLETIIAVEVDNWKKKWARWVRNADSLSDCLYEYITTPHVSYQPAMLLIFKEPYLLKEYAGVQSVDDLLNGRPAAVRTLSAPVAHLYFGKPDDSRTIEKPIQALLNKNAYYKECRKFMKEYEDHVLGEGSTTAGCIFNVLAVPVAVFTGLLVGFLIFAGLSELLNDGDIAFGISGMLMGAGVIGFFWWLCGWVARTCSPAKDYWDFMKGCAAREQQLHAELNDKYNQI